MQHALFHLEERHFLSKLSFFIDANLLFVIAISCYPHNYPLGYSQIPQFSHLPDRRFIIILL